MSERLHQALRELEAKAKTHKDLDEETRQRIQSGIKVEDCIVVRNDFYERQLVYLDDVKDLFSAFMREQAAREQKLRELLKNRPRADKWDDSFTYEDKIEEWAKEVEKVFDDSTQKEPKQK